MLATIEMLDFLVNWLEHASRVEMRNVLVIAMDEHTAMVRRERRGANRRLGRHRQVGDGRPGRGCGGRGISNDEGFNLLGEAKTASIAKLLDMGLNVFLSDVDVVWLRNPSITSSPGSWRSRTWR